MHKNIVITRTISFLLIFIIILGVYFIIHYKAKYKVLEKRAIPTVTVFTVGAKKYQPKITAIGYFVANQGITLKSEVDGQITKINFSSGKNIKQGDVLVEFENSKEKGALAYAKAQYDLSVTTYQRNMNLQKTGAVSEEALDEAKTSLDADQGSVMQAQGDYDKTIITAPFTGRVGLKNISIGDYLNSGDDIVTLQSLNPMYIDFSIAEKYLAQIKLNNTVEVKPNTMPGEVIKGTVKSYETVIDEDTGMIQVRASVENNNGYILPGGYAEVTLYAGDEKLFLTVPQTAIVYDVAGNYVYLIKKQKAIKQLVTLGQQINQSIEISTGVLPGDEVVIAGTNKIHNGSEVNVTNKN